MKPNQTVFFRQDIPHQGMGYKENNLRIFIYWDVKNTKRTPNSTFPINLHKKKFISESELKLKQAYDAMKKTENLKIF